MIDLETISILCPTRNRINTSHGNFVHDMMLSCDETADNPESLEFVFYIDDDDTDSDSYFDSLDDSRVKVVRASKIIMSEMTNVCYDESSGDILFGCADDIRVRTPGWDTIVRNKFEEFDDRIIHVFGDDGIGPKGKTATHFFLHRNWIEAIGYFTPPYFSSDMSDCWVHAVADAVDRSFYVDIYTEHLHPQAGKYFWDNTHQERLVRHNNDDVHALYASDELVDKREEDVRALFDFIDIDDSAKEGALIRIHKNPVGKMGASYEDV